MTKRILFILLVALSLPLHAQISHGGEPLFLFKDKDGLRNAANDPSLFVEMPAFDVDSLLMEDSLNEANMRGAYRFAHKFFQSLEIGRSGHNFTLADGTRVWQVGIRSKGAYSINLLFSEFHLPEGGKLFLYNTARSHVLGAFTHKNNNDDNLLPTSPVSGDEIIVEYSQPADAEFDARLKISEINHDYRGVLRIEPFNKTSPDHACMPDILCSEGKDLDVNRSAVLLIIDGNALCSGSMINNTADDETPYLLTAMHCFNYSRPVHFPMEHYIKKGGTIVAFFHYNRPVCDTEMRGVQEMSVAGAHVRSVIEPLDLALLELKQSPPDYYRPYYAGWNVDPKVHKSTQFVTNIHHPYGDLSKFGKTTNPLDYTSYTGIDLFEKNAFWKVPGWTTGSTAGGSSGSPLFDQDNLIIGALTGGNSYCSGNNPNGATDYFSRLHLGWNYEQGIDSLRALSLSNWLDKGNSNKTSHPGLETSGDTLIKKSNADYTHRADKLHNTIVKSDTDFLFGANLRQTVEFAEEFQVDGVCQIHGAYILTPPDITYPSEIKLHVYAADGNKPGQKLASTVFRPTYTNYPGGTHKEQAKTFKEGAESFVRWQELPEVSKRFFIAYELPSSTAPFRTYNIVGVQRNSAWINDPVLGWTEAGQYPVHRIQTSLAIQALITGVKQPEEPEEEHPPLRYVQSSRSLHFTTDEHFPGTAYLYDMNGRCLEEVSFEGNLVYYVKKIPHNTLGFIHLISGEKTWKLKVIY